MSREITCLDKGYIRLVDVMGSDLSIVRAARVSYNADWREGNDEGLIKYMLDNGHTSPFEHVIFSFEVKAPIFVFRQWHRHRTWSFNEVSGRYAELAEEFYIPDPSDIGKQSSSNKQARERSPMLLTEDEEAARKLQRSGYILSCEEAFRVYNARLLYGWPRELARIVLPLSTYSRMYATVDLHNLLKFVALRDHEHAQYEIQVYARAIRDFIQDIVPVTYSAWSKK